MARGDLTDGEWERIRRYLPVSPLGRLPRNLRKQIDGVNWRYRTGSQWREIPERYGHWNTVYQLHRRYCRDGTWCCPTLKMRMSAASMLGPHGDGNALPGVSRAGRWCSRCRWDRQ
ncbi:transposase, partial [Actinocrinis puniceicyclus]